MNKPSEPSAGCKNKYNQEFHRSGVSEIKLKRTLRHLRGTRGGDEQKTYYLSDCEGFSDQGHVQITMIKDCDN